MKPTRRDFLKVAGILPFAIPSYANAQPNANAPQENLAQKVARYVHETKERPGISYREFMNLLDPLGAGNQKPPMSYVDVLVQVKHPTIEADVELKLYHNPFRDEKFNYDDPRNQIKIMDSGLNRNSISGLTEAEMQALFDAGRKRPNGVGGAGYFIDKGLTGKLDFNGHDNQQAYQKALERLASFYESLRKK